jgi:hypothetical protein
MPTGKTLGKQGLPPKRRSRTSNSWKDGQRQQPLHASRLGRGIPKPTGKTLSEKAPPKIKPGGGFCATPREKALPASLPAQTGDRTGASLGASAAAVLLQGRKHCPFPILPRLETALVRVSGLRRRLCYSKRESTARFPSCPDWRPHWSKSRGFGGGCATPREKALPASHPAQTGDRTGPSLGASVAAVLLQEKKHCRLLLPRHWSPQAPSDRISRSLCASR